MEIEIQHNLRHNMMVNIFDGAFFGLGLGFISFTTILPLFVASMTDSPLLIGLIPAIHTVGWQLPQLFTARWVARQPRIKPLVLSTTIQERLPFLLLACVAWFAPVIGKPLALALTFAMLVWQGLGAGLTANPWQSMIGKIIPSEQRSTFIGAQAAAANLFASVSAVIAGIILTSLDGPADYTLIFLLGSLAMTISWFFLARTREPARSGLAVHLTTSRAEFWSNMRRILRQDVRFRWFLVARILSQFILMGAAFYSVFAVQQHGASEGTGRLDDRDVIGHSYHRQCHNGLDRRPLEPQRSDGNRPGGGSDWGSGGMVGAQRRLVLPGLRSHRNRKCGDLDHRDQHEHGFRHRSRTANLYRYVEYIDRPGEHPGPFPGRLVSPDRWLSGSLPGQRGGRVHGNFSLLFSGKIPIRR